MGGSSRRYSKQAIRCAAWCADPDRLKGRAWAQRVEIAVGDVLRPDTLPDALTGVEAAFYPVHSMNDSAEFHQRDLQAARNFGAGARQPAVNRRIYLGRLGDPATKHSNHLRFRQETGEALRQSGLPLTKFRAAVIVGAGSISLEMVRTMTERLPLMICPRRVFTRIQPIAILDVLAYLVAALQVEASAVQIAEIGGADVLTYAEMRQGCARVRGLRRLIIPVPVLTPRLSAYWAHWMTPIPLSIAHPLI